MTVRELKEKLEQFPEKSIVLIPIDGRLGPATNVAFGFNELDGCVIIDDYVEDEE
jgi:hypothetical protein